MSSINLATNTPPSPTKRINVVFAWVAVHADQGEGLVAISTAFGMFACVADEELVAQLMRPHIAAQMGALSKDQLRPTRIELRRYGSLSPDVHNYAVLERLEPQADRSPASAESA